MAGGINGFFSALWLQFSSIFSGERRKILENPEVMGEILDREVESMIKDFAGHERAVADVMAVLITDKKARERIAAEVAELEEENVGAITAAQERAAKLTAQGKVLEEIEADPEYLEAQAAYQDNASTIDEKAQRIADLDVRIAANEEKVRNHKILLQKAQRAIQKRRADAKDTVAQAHADKALIRVNQQLSNLSERTEDKAASEVRDVAASLSARAQISGELAGNDATVAREKFKVKAKDRKAKDAFASAVGIAGAKDKAVAVSDAPAATAERAKLPE